MTTVWCCSFNFRSRNRYCNENIDMALNRNCNYIFIYLVALVRRPLRDCFVLRVKLSPVYHTLWRLHTVSFFAEGLAGKLWNVDTSFWSLVWPDRELNPSLPFEQQVFYPFDQRSVNEIYVLLYTIYASHLHICIYWNSTTVVVRRIY